MTGEEFKETLRLIGWKQSDLARKMDVHRNTVSAWASDGPPQWAQEYVRAMLAIKALHDGFVKAPPRQHLEEFPDDPPENSRAAKMAAKLNRATTAA